MVAACYEHDPRLGHEFHAITGATDECRLCGCTVSASANHHGKGGSRFNEPCTRAKPSAMGANGGGETDITR